MTDRCSTRTRMKEQDKAMEEGANQAKAGTTKRHPKNTTSTTDKTLQTCKAERMVGDTLLESCIVLLSVERYPNCFSNSWNVVEELMALSYEST